MNKLTKLQKMVIACSIELSKIGITVGTVVYVNDAILDGRDGMCVQSNGKKEYSIIVDSSFLDERIPDTELREIVMRQLLFTVDAPGESLAFWIRAVNSIKYKLNVNINFRKILEEDNYVNRN